MHILLIDDHALFREALLYVLRELDEQVVILEAATSQEALQLAKYYHELDLILLDLALPGLDGLAVLPKLRALAPTVPLVVLSASEKPADVRQALENGAAGYIPKSCSSHEMITALRLVLTGKIYLPTALLAALETLEASPSPLETSAYVEFTPRQQAEFTPRQLEVLHLMGQGLSNKGIGKHLHVAEGTVKLHVAAILRLLNTCNRTQAVIEASRRGLIAHPDQSMSS